MLEVLDLSIVQGVRKRIWASTRLIALKNVPRSPHAFQNGLVHVEIAERRKTADETYIGDLPCGGLITPF